MDENDAWSGTIVLGRVFVYGRVSALPDEIAATTSLKLGVRLLL